MVMWCKNVVIANSDGEYVEDERIRTRFVVNAVAAEGSTIQTGFEAVGGTVGFELFSDKCSARKRSRRGGRKAILMLGARPSSGRMAVVMAWEAGGTMVHEACGHGLEADHIQKQLSVYAAKRAISGLELISVVDDATLPENTAPSVMMMKGAGQAESAD